MYIECMTDLDACCAHCKAVQVICYADLDLALNSNMTVSLESTRTLFDAREWMRCMRSDVIKGAECSAVQYSTFSSPSCPTTML